MNPEPVAPAGDPYLHALLRLPGLFAAVFSRDGRWVAWTWARVGPTMQVFAAPTDGSAPPMQLTDSNENTHAVSWTPDSSAVIVGHDHDGDERVRLFRVDLAQPGLLQPLTEANPTYFLHGGELHPSGRWLIYAANFDAATGQEIEPTWVYRHDLQSGERRVLARPAKGGHPQPDLNEQGTHILYNRQDLDPAGNQVWLVDIEGADDREILNYGPAVKVWASWFPDGQRAIVLAETATHRRVEVWDRLTGTTHVLLDDSARNIESVSIPAGSDGRTAVLVEVRDAGVHAALLDTDTGAEYAVPAVPGNLIPLHPLAEQEGTVGGHSLLPDGTVAEQEDTVGGHSPLLPDGTVTDDNTQSAIRNPHWIAAYSSAQQPTDLVQVDLSNPQPGAFTSLTRLWERTDIRPVDLTAAQSIHWQSTDGRTIQGWWYAAAPPAHGTIVFVHGGPTYHSSDALNTQIQYLVRQGFNVLDPNYRGSTGFSVEFRDAIKADGWGGREQDDIRAGISALIANGLAERGRVGVTGTSYGGYSSWCQITHTPSDLVAAAAPICGMTDLVVDYETTRPDLRPYSEEMMGGRPDQVPDRYHERSPIHFVAAIQGQLLIVQGAQDPNVTPANVRAVESALQAAGIPYETLVFADEGHGISRPANLHTLLPRLAAFFGRAFAPAGEGT